MSKKLLLLPLMLSLLGCELKYTSLQEFFTNPVQMKNEPKPLKPRSIVICRGRQCAPAKLSMSREYVHNSLMHLLDNNNHKTALVCEADAGSHICTESYVTIPITVGITPAHMYIDSVKIVDVSIGKKNKQLNLTLSYNVTFNGQSPDCIPAQSIAYVKTVNDVVLEDNGYSCKMTSIGQTSIKTLVAVDYIDLDYGFIGGYYSIGASGPAYGGGSGYLIIRLPKDAYPLSPVLEKGLKNKDTIRELMQVQTGIDQVEQTAPVNSSVEVFPISR